MYEKLAIKDATPQQLRDFAREHLGIQLPPNAKDETLLAKIKQAWNQEHIFVAEPEEQENPPKNSVERKAADPAQQAPAVKPLEKGGDPRVNTKVTIHIGVTEAPGGDRPVEVAVNGQAMLIPRGEDVEIPWPYYHVLQNAVQDKYDVDDNGNIIPEPRKVPLYPVSRVA